VSSAQRHGTCGQEQHGSPGPCRTIACRRPPIAYAHTSLRPLAAPEARRSAPRGESGLAGESWGRQAPSTAGVRVVGRHASGVSVASCYHRAPWHGWRVWGVPLPRALTPLRVRAVLPTRPWRRAGGPEGDRTARGPVVLVRAPHGVARRVRHWCGLVRRPRGVCGVVAQSGGSPAGFHWRQPVRYPSDGLPSHRRGVGVCPRRQEPVGRCRREPAVWGRRRAGAGARRGCLCRVRRRCLVRRRPAGVSHVRRERGALEARLCGDCTASLPCVGGGGTVPTVSRLSKRVARVRRGRGHACALGCPAGGGAPGPVGTGQAGSRGHSGAEQGLAGDRQQPPLVPRYGSWRRLKPSVRLSEAGITHACSGFKTYKGPR
jgi:hypothetical protein